MSFFHLILMVAISIRKMIKIYHSLPFHLHHSLQIDQKTPNYFNTKVHWNFHQLIHLRYEVILAKVEDFLLKIIHLNFDLMSQSKLIRHVINYYYSVLFVYYLDFCFTNFINFDQEYKIIWHEELLLSQPHQAR